MNIKIVPVKSLLLKNFIEYFIFSNVRTGETEKYTSLPNTNLCLSLLKSCKVNYLKTNSINSVDILPGSDTFNSRLWGIHKLPLTVNIEGPFEQVCILFHRGSLKFFSKHSVVETLPEDNVFHILFNQKNNFFLEELFDTVELDQRASLLEFFLLKKLENNPCFEEIDHVIKAIETARGHIDLKALAKQFNIGTSTLFRSFMQKTGYAPKHFAATVRFRSAMQLMMDHIPLTEICYDLDYFDQSHFIKEFKKYTSYTPHKLKNKISVFDKKLILIIK
jgi:AraC-like DNA-binding protein